jgi:hypothetical protein
LQSEPSVEGSQTIASVAPGCSAATGEAVTLRIGQ